MAAAAAAGATREPVREACIRPADDLLSPGDGDADVDGRKRVRQLRHATVTEVEGGGDEEREIDERSCSEQRETRPRTPKRVAQRETGEQ